MREQGCGTRWILKFKEVDSLNNFKVSLRKWQGEVVNAMYVFCVCCRAAK